MLRRLFETTTTPLLGAIARPIHRMGIQPDHVTYLGMFVSIAAGVAFWQGRWVTGGVILLVAGLFDMLDGALAREGRSGSKFGAFLDSTCDRISDAAIYLGVLFSFLRADEPFYWALITCLAFLAAFMTSYTRARAESLISRCDVGIAERPERTILIILGALVRQMKTVMVILVLISSMTVFQRVLHTRKMLGHGRTGP